MIHPVITSAVNRGQRRLQTTAKIGSGVRDCFAQRNVMNIINKHTKTQIQKYKGHVNLFTSTVSQKLIDHKIVIKIILHKHIHGWMQNMLTCTVCQMAVNWPHKLVDIITSWTGFDFNRIGLDMAAVIVPVTADTSSDHSILKIWMSSVQP